MFKYEQRLARSSLTRERQLIWQEKVGIFSYAIVGLTS